MFVIDMYITTLPNARPGSVEAAIKAAVTRSHHNTGDNNGRLPIRPIHHHDWNHGAEVAFIKERRASLELWALKLKTSDVFNTPRKLIRDVCVAAGKAGTSPAKPHYDPWTVMLEGFWMKMLRAHLKREIAEAIIASSLADETMSRLPRMKSLADAKPDSVPVALKQKLTRSPPPSPPRARPSTPLPAMGDHTTDVTQVTSPTFSTTQTSAPTPATEVGRTDVVEKIPELTWSPQRHQDTLALLFDNAPQVEQRQEYSAEDNAPQVEQRLPHTTQDNAQVEQRLEGLDSPLPPMGHESPASLPVDDGETPNSPFQPIGGESPALLPMDDNVRAVPHLGSEQMPIDVEGLVDEPLFQSSNQVVNNVIAYLTNLDGPSMIHVLALTFLNACTYAANGTNVMKFSFLVNDSRVYFSWVLRLLPESCSAGTDPLSTMLQSLLGVNPSWLNRDIMDIYVDNINLQIDSLVRDPDVHFDRDILNWLSHDDSNEHTPDLIIPARHLTGGLLTKPKLLAIHCVRRMHFCEVWAVVESGVTRVTITDSLNTTNKRQSGLRRLFAALVKVENSVWHNTTVEFLFPTVRLQDNGSDCGPRATRKALEHLYPGIPEFYDMFLQRCLMLQWYTKQVFMSDRLPEAQAPPAPRAPRAPPAPPAPPAPRAPRAAPAPRAPRAPRAPPAPPAPPAPVDEPEDPEPQRVTVQQQLQLVRTVAPVQAAVAVAVPLPFVATPVFTPSAGLAQQGAELDWEAAWDHVAFQQRADSTEDMPAFIPAEGIHMQSLPDICTVASKRSIRLGIVGARASNRLEIDSAVALAHRPYYVAYAWCQLFHPGETSQMLELVPVGVTDTANDTRPRFAQLVGANIRLTIDPNVDADVIDALNFASERNLFVYVPYCQAVRSSTVMMPHAMSTQNRVSKESFLQQLLTTMDRLFRDEILTGSREVAYIGLGTDVFFSCVQEIPQMCNRWPNIQLTLNLGWHDASKTMVPTTAYPQADINFTSFDLRRLAHLSVDIHPLIFPEHLVQNAETGTFFKFCGDRELQIIIEHWVVNFSKLTGHAQAINAGISLWADPRLRLAGSRSRSILKHSPFLTFIRLCMLCGERKTPWIVYGINGDRWICSNDH